MQPSYESVSHPLTMTVIKYLFAKFIPDLIKIFGLEESLRAPLLDPFFVEGMIMKRED